MSHSLAPGLRHASRAQEQRHDHPHRHDRPCRPRVCHGRAARAAGRARRRAGAAGRAWQSVCFDVAAAAPGQPALRRLPSRHYRGSEPADAAAIGLHRGSSLRPVAAGTHAGRVHDAHTYRPAAAYGGSLPALSVGAGRNALRFLCVGLWRAVVRRGIALRRDPCRSGTPAACGAGHRTGCARLVGRLA